jgi:hypothetical protein
MKHKLYTLALFLITASVLSSCESDLEFGSDYVKSYRTWLNFKESSGNAYAYTVSGSSWVGLAWETTLTISNGKVLQREFRFTQIADYPIADEDQEWIETGTELGTHEATPAAAAVTLDEVYQKAKNNWLQTRSGTRTYFETENDGMISLCGYVPKGCADDCFTGIRIARIEMLP